MTTKRAARRLGVTAILVASVHGWSSSYSPPLSLSPLAATAPLTALHLSSSIVSEGGKPWQSWKNGLVQQVSKWKFAQEERRLAREEAQEEAVATTASATTTVAVPEFIHQWWWSFPLLLTVLPVLHWICSGGQFLLTPMWWKMRSIPAMLTHTPHVGPILTGFLGSNIVYPVAGTYLWKKNPGRKFGDAYFGLGGWVWTAGIVSMVFHTFQAVGSPVVAETLCYLDHGVAGAGILYFWKMCGRPRKSTTALIMAGLVTLAWPTAYFGLHSLWHVLSAWAAIDWTRQGKIARRSALLRAVQRKSG